MPSVLIIIGPTASGKTQCADDLICKFGIRGAVINADVGQFYTPLNVGTAKPVLKQLNYPTYGFNIIDTPEEVSVVFYRSLVCDTVTLLERQQLIPIIVGGSLFYIKSLFYPPQIHAHAHEARGKINNYYQDNQDKKNMWKELYSIDPVRARAIHQHDFYRIERALMLWKTTGRKPSEYEPQLDIPFRAFVVMIQPDREVLRKNIMHRLEHMIYHAGWIDEVKKLIGTPWEAFLCKKRLIGYAELFAWLHAGGKQDDLAACVERIGYNTLHYAKRQVTFWRGLKKRLEYERGTGSIEAIQFETINREIYIKIVNLFNKFLLNKN